MPVKVFIMKYFEIICQYLKHEVLTIRFIFLNNHCFSMNILVTLIKPVSLHDVLTKQQIISNQTIV